MGEGLADPSAGPLVRVVMAGLKGLDHRRDPGAGVLSVRAGRLTPTLPAILLNRPTIQTIVPAGHPDQALSPECRPSCGHPQ